MANISEARLAELLELAREDVPAVIGVSRRELLELVTMYCPRDPDDPDQDGPMCAAIYEGARCAYHHGHDLSPHWTITKAGEVTWTEESLALGELAKQFRRVADGLNALAEAAACGAFRRE